MEKDGTISRGGRVNYERGVKRPSETVLVVESADVRKEITWDQTERMGEWRDLGVFDLKSGATLEIDVARSTGTVIADVFALEPTSKNN